MKYKEAKQIVIEDFKKKLNLSIRFGWQFRLNPKLRKQLKQWATHLLEEEI